MNRSTTFWQWLVSLSKWDMTRVKIQMGNMHTRSLSLGPLSLGYVLGWVESADFPYVSIETSEVLLPTKNTYLSSRLLQLPRNTLDSFTGVHFVDHRCDACTFAIQFRYSNFLRDQTRRRNFRRVWSPRRNFLRVLSREGKFRLKTDHEDKNSYTIEPEDENFVLDPEEGTFFDYTRRCNFGRDWTRQPGDWTSEQLSTHDDKFNVYSMIHTFSISHCYPYTGWRISVISAHIPVGAPFHKKRHPRHADHAS